jgi:hypothetical protein
MTRIEVIKQIRYIRMHCHEHISKLDKDHPIYIFYPELLGMFWDTLEYLEDKGEE